MQVKSLLRLDNLEIEFSNDYYNQVSKLAIQSKMGARALKSLVENSLINIMFRIDEFNNNGVNTIRFDNYPYKGNNPIRSKISTIHFANLKYTSYGLAYTYVGQDTRNM